MLAEAAHSVAATGTPAGVALHQRTGDVAWDAAAAIVMGVLLM